MSESMRYCGASALPDAGFGNVSQAFVRLVALLAALAATLCCRDAGAGVMDKAAMLAAFPPPLIVGDKERDLPVWPIFKQDATATPLVGYVFESIDLAPIPGFAGVPYNLLVMLDARGEFVDVRVLSQHEPVFLDGLGPEPLERFVAQYRGLSLTRNIRIGTSLDRRGEVTDGTAHLDGVTKATASVRILNQSLLSSALKVARARLGFAPGRDPDQVARVRSERFTPMDWEAMLDAGLVTRRVISNRELEAAFAGTPAAGLDGEALRRPDEPFVELYVAHLGVPSVGRNLLQPRAWDYLRQRLEPGDHALLVVSRGRYAIVGEDFVRASVSDRLTLRQQTLPIEMRDMDLAESLDLFALDYKIGLPAALADAQWRVFQVIAPAGLDVAQPLEFELAVTRRKGQMFPEQVTRSFPVRAVLPAPYFEPPASDDKTWHSIWADRALELAILAAALALLLVLLSRHDRLARDLPRLRRLRTAYLLFTLVFIGWYAQGQLSIVNLTALVQAVADGRSLSFFLYDPMTVVLWGFVGVTLVRWGRGTFCGWLCPFGALQELLSLLARCLHVPQLRLRARTDARLKRLKYAVLAAILAAAVTSAELTSRVVEVEPFKTSITLVFDRAWPYVLWAAALLGLGMVVYKGFCRYLCPLGAGLVLAGRMHRFDWLARRAECGRPCRRCEHVCGYQAIARSGTIDYDECFQCLDCVAIYQSDRLCAPLMLARRKPSPAAAAAGRG